MPCTADLERRDYLDFFPKRPQGTTKILGTPAFAGTKTPAVLKFSSKGATTDCVETPVNCPHCGQKRPGRTSVPTPAVYTEKEAAETAAAKADAEQAKQDRDTASQKLISSQSEIKRSIGTLRKTARKTADDRAKKIARRIKSLIIAALVIIMIATAIATVIVGISSSSGILTFIVALISGLSAATLWLPLMKVGNLLENRLFNKIEGTLYIKELARVTPQIQVLEDLLKDSSSAT